MSKPSNPLKEALPMWVKMTKGLHLSDYEFPIEVIEGGYKVCTEGLGPLSPSDFQTYEGDQAFSIFNNFSELLEAGKLLGPFEVGALDVKGLVAFFLVEKPGRLDAHGRKVYRLIIDASRECLLYGYQKDLILSWLNLRKLKNDDFPRNYLDLEGGIKTILTLAKKETGIKTSINDFIDPVDMQVDFAHDIIMGLMTCSFLAKADLWRGFRQIISHFSTWLYTCILLQVIHPVTGKVHKFVFSDPTACQGFRASPGMFNTVVRCLLRILVFHFPELFTKSGSRKLLKEIEAEFGTGWSVKKVAKRLKTLNLDTPLHVKQERFEENWQDRNVYQYLDDIVTGADSKLMCDLQLTMLIFWAEQLGFEFNPEKIDWASHVQTILGYVFDAKNKLVSLKPKFVSGLIQLITTYKDDLNNLKLGRKIFGKLIFGCRICSRLYSFLSALNKVVTSLVKSDTYEKATALELVQDLTWIADFLKANGENGPSVSVEMFLNHFPVIATPGFSDASGWEKYNNPSQGTMGCLWVPKYLPASECIVMSMQYSSLREAIRVLTGSSLDLPAEPSIAYLEFYAMVLLVLWFVIFRPHSLRRKCLIVKVDNTNVIGWSDKGRMKFRVYNFILKLFCVIELFLDCKIKLVYIKSKENRIADSLTREKANSKSISLKFRGRRGSFVKRVKVSRPPVEIIRVLASILSSPWRLLGVTSFQQILDSSSSSSSQVGSKLLRNHKYPSQVLFPQTALIYLCMTLLSSIPP